MSNSKFDFETDRTLKAATKNELAAKEHSAASRNQNLPRKNCCAQSRKGRRDKSIADIVSWCFSALTVQ